MGAVVRRSNALAKTETEFERNLMSDDECVQKLASLIAIEKSRDLEELAKLISRLAITIE